MICNVISRKCVAKCITGNFVQEILVILFAVFDIILFVLINGYRKGDWRMCYVITCHNKTCIVYVRVNDNVKVYQIII